MLREAFGDWGGGSNCTLTESTAIGNLMSGSFVIQGDRNIKQFIQNERNLRIKNVYFSRLNYHTVTTESRLQTLDLLFTFVN